MTNSAVRDDILSAIEKQTAAIERQTEMLGRLIQIQESILILMAEDRDPDVEPQSYLSGRPVR